VEAMLGHKSATCAKRYAHLATDAMKMALREVAKKAPTKEKRGLRELHANPRHYLVGPPRVELGTNGL
jgi:hypothetical protein